MHRLIVFLVKRLNEFKGGHKQICLRMLQGTLANEPVFHTQSAMYGVAIFRASFRALSFVPKA